MEPSAFSEFAFDLYRAFHLVYDIFRNRHSESCAFGFVYAHTVLARERLEYFFLKFGRHSYAVVLNDYVRTHIIVAYGRRLLIDGKLDRAFFVGELDCIGEKIQKHLIETNAVAIDAFLNYIFYIDVEVLLFDLYLRLNNRRHAFEHFSQRDLFHIKRHFAAFDFRHIEYVVYESQKVFARESDFFKTVVYLLFIIHVCACDRRHADNGVHGRANVVRHIGQEFAFCRICAYCRLFCGVKLIHVLAVEVKV